MIGSLLFALPMVIDKGLTGDGTLGLKLLDITDHWVFNYSLLIVGFFEVLMIGWLFGAENLRTAINQYAKVKLGKWFVFLIKYVIPLLLLIVISSSLASENGWYGDTYDMPGFSWLPIFIPIFWLVSTLIFAYVLTNMKSKEA